MVASDCLRWFQLRIDVDSTLAEDWGIYSLLIIVAVDFLLLWLEHCCRFLLWICVDINGIEQCEMKLTNSPGVCSSPHGKLQNFCQSYSNQRMWRDSGNGWLFPIGAWTLCYRWRSVRKEARFWLSRICVSPCLSLTGVVCNFLPCRRLRVAKLWLRAVPRHVGYAIPLSSSDGKILCLAMDQGLAKNNPIATTIMNALCNKLTWVCVGDWGYDLLQFPRF